ncbi:hypothetical protein BH24ACI4_BH24ACI4_10640 [soil metagenome]
MTSAHTTELRRLRRATNGRPAVTAALVVAIIVLLVAGPQAQQAPPAFAATAPPASAYTPAAVDMPTDVDLLVGRSTILNVGSAIARVSLTVPDVADAMVTAPSQLLIHGKQPGTISLFVWDRAGAIKTFEVKVRRDLTPLVGHLKQLFPTETMTVMGSGKDVVISGTVSSKYVIEKAAEVAGGYVEKKENVVNLLQQQEGVASNQVMLRVRFAEVSRNALQELGASLFSDGNNNYFGRTTTQQFAAPFFDQNKANMGQSLVFSDYLNLFLFDAKNQLGAVVKALQGRGVFQSLAEPNMVALSGREATFLAGGEFPIPVVQGGAGGSSVTILFKEFGVRLSFTPTILGGDLINLKIRPEVSALDFNNAVVIEGFRVPALTTRRADTEVELSDGQTFAIAGLMNNTALSSMRKVPGLGDIPILGNLFRSRAYQKEQTELVVMVTPQIIRRGAPGVSEALPSLVEPYLAAPGKRLPTPDPYVGSPRYPVSQPAPSRSATPDGSPASESAAVASPASVGAQAPSAGQGSHGGRSVSSHDLSVSEHRTAVEGTATMSLQAGPTPAPSPGEEPRIPPTAIQPPTPQERKALEQARRDEQRAVEAARRADAAADRERLAEEQRAAERQKAEARADEKRLAEQVKKQDEQRRQQERLEADRMRREAEVAKRQAEEDQKRQKSVADAEQRLKAAQAAYEAELARTSRSASR